MCATHHLVCLTRFCSPEQLFFESMHRALRPGGVICTQGECMWLHLDLIKQVMDLFREVLPRWGPPAWQAARG